jgi:hypothetical protein
MSDLEVGDLLELRRFLEQYTREVSTRSHSSTQRPILYGRVIARLLILVLWWVVCWDHGVQLSALGQSGPRFELLEVKANCYQEFLGKTYTQVRGYRRRHKEYREMTRRVHA